MRRARPKVVLFDLGGVLLPFDRERRVAAIVEELGIEADAAHALVGEEFATRLDLGTADERELAAAMTDACGRPVNATEARRLLLSVFEPPNMALWSRAQRLRAQVKVGALSDNPACVREVLPAEGGLDELFLSCELGLAKPAPAVFAEVTRRLAVAPEEILFVDDNPANVEAARAAGWDAVVYVSNDQLDADLVARGLA